MPSGVAFVMMLAVTAATAVMAWTQDAEILAAFALIGGFTTPLLLSTGQNREVALFAYVAILDLGALALVILKPWRRLLLLSYVGTLLLYVGWYSSFYERQPAPHDRGFRHAILRHLCGRSVAGAPGESKGGLSESVPLFLALGKCRRIFSANLRHVRGDRYQGHGLVRSGSGGVYIFLSRQTRARATTPEAARTVDLLHLALAIGFITVAIPIRLDAHWITIGWFVEAAVLLWVADRIHSELLNAVCGGRAGAGRGPASADRQFLRHDVRFSTPGWRPTPWRSRCWAQSPGTAAAEKMKPDALPSPFP